MVLLEEWSTVLDLCSWGHKVLRVKVDVRVSCSEPELKDIVLVCQAEVGIVDDLQEAACHPQRMQHEIVGREVWSHVLDKCNE